MSLKLPRMKPITFCKRCGKLPIIQVSVNDNRSCGCPNYMIPEWRVSYMGQIFKTITFSLDGYVESYEQDVA